MSANISEDEFPVDQLPPHIQRSILEKLNYTEYSRFDQCSTLSHSICEHNEKVFFPLEVKSFGRRKNFFVRIGDDYKVTTDVPDDARVMIHYHDMRIHHPTNTVYSVTSEK